MADSRKINATNHSHPVHLDYTNQPNQHQHEQYDQSDRGNVDYNLTQNNYQAYASHTMDEEYESQYNTPTTSAPPGPLRYEIGRYVPSDGYFDCDMYVLVKDAGLNKTNCFGCARPSSICKPGFPNCPPDIRCIFCEERFDTHPGSSPFCHKMWAFTNFLQKYAGWDMSRGLPEGIPVKPNAKEAKYLIEQGFMKSTQYYDHNMVRKEFYQWLDPVRDPRIPVHNFYGLTKNQKTKLLNEQNKEVDARGYRFRAHQKQKAAHGPVTLAKGKKRAYSDETHDNAMPPPTAPTKRQRQDDNTSHYGYHTPARRDYVDSPPLPTTMQENTANRFGQCGMRDVQDDVWAQRDSLPLPTTQQAILVNASDIKDNKRAQRDALPLPTTQQAMLMNAIDIKDNKQAQRDALPLPTTQQAMFTNTRTEQDYKQAQRDALPLPTTQQAMLTNTRIERDNKRALRDALPLPTTQQEPRSAPLNPIPNEPQSHAYSMTQEQCAQTSNNDSPDLQWSGMMIRGASNRVFSNDQPRGSRGRGRGRGRVNSRGHWNNGRGRGS
ncbi:hypothetical protein GT037_006588 [Alternaria burnsii]|uniref:Uncharacterized protein n=1 Tax=Alternaria burnsii TaxID=1187904 RepID=A0A8H7EHD9_9PLEO|nr:uncharacterized protein GT037_006588 [Alternaria burnsii]KAF7675869.1 hypothetical protein GT037_006588 [Alternaria burnsii]CAI9626547.1 unnamed protein product [Alternaria burnsii]